MSSDELRELIKVLKDVKRRLISFDLILGAAIYLSFGLISMGSYVLLTFLTTASSAVAITVNAAYWVITLVAAYVKVFKPLIKHIRRLEAALPDKGRGGGGALVIALSVIAAVISSGLTVLILRLITGSYQAYYPQVSLLVSLAVLNAVINRRHPWLATVSSISLAVGAASVPLAYSIVPNISFLWGYTIIVIAMVYSGIGLYLILKATHFITSERHGSLTT